MTKDIFNEYFRIRKPNGEIDIEKEYFGINIQNCETEAIMIRNLKNPEKSNYNVCEKDFLKQNTEISIIISKT